MNQRRLLSHVLFLTMFTGGVIVSSAPIQAQEGDIKMPDTVLKQGDTAPDFDLPTNGDSRVSLADLKGKTVVLYFYPKDHTSGCTTEACDFRDNITDFDSAETVILGISNDTVKSHDSFAAKYELPFKLLADVDKSVTKAYGVLKEKKNYGRTYWGIERTTFVIGPDGKIKAVFSKVKVDGHVAEVLSAIN